MKQRKPIGPPSKYDHADAFRLGFALGASGGSIKSAVESLSWSRATITRWVALGKAAKEGTGGDARFIPLYEQTDRRTPKGRQPKRETDSFDLAALGLEGLADIFDRLDLD
jgi:hypothetical protein